MLDGVLRWLVGVTGLEPRLLTCTAILMVYAASVYLKAKKESVAGVPAQAQPVEFGELASALARVERGVETVAKYLVNLERQPSGLRFQLKHEYEAFLPSRVVGAPPRNHHSPLAGFHFEVDTPRRHRPEKYPSSPEAGIHIGQDIEEDEPYFPIPAPITPKSKQPGFFLPIPQATPYQPPEQEPQPEEPPIQPEQEEPQLQPDQGQPVQPLSPAAMKMLRMSRKAGRTP